MKSQMMKKFWFAILFAMVLLFAFSVFLDGLNAKEKRVVPDPVRDDSVQVFGGVEKIKTPKHILAPVGKIELTLDVGATNIVATWDTTASSVVDIWLIDPSVIPTYPDEDVVDKRICSRGGREVFVGLKHNKEYGIWSVPVGPPPFYIRGEAWGTTFRTLGQPSLSAVDKPSIDFAPDNFELMQNYPNPFNPTTKISFRLPESSRVILKVYNTLGQEVATLIDGTITAGDHTTFWNAREVPSGIYFAILQTDNFSKMIRMQFIK